MERHEVGEVDERGQMKWSNIQKAAAITLTPPLDGVADSYWQLHDVLDSPSIDNGNLISRLN
jgi:hypothetical protein